MNQDPLGNPFFIFSPGRSGTSLLTRMLNQHPNIAVPYESHFFNTFRPILKYYGDIGDRTQMENLVRDVLSTDVMNDWEPRLTQEEIMGQLKDNNFWMLFDALMRAWTLKCNKKRWGEKTPHHIRYWREIRELYPNAKFIHIVRDGRDVSLSFLHARFGPKSIFHGALRWKNYLEMVEELKSKLPAEDFIELKYEDLIETPASCLEEICKFIGEEYDETMLQYYKNKSSYNTDKINQENLHKKLLKNNKEKWKDQLSDSEIYLFESIAGQQLKKYGYPLIYAGYPPPSTFRIYYYRFLKGPLRKLNAMLKNTKGQRDAWIRFQIMVKVIFRYYVAKLLVLTNKESDAFF